MVGGGLPGRITFFRLMDIPLPFNVDDLELTPNKNEKKSGHHKPTIVTTEPYTFALNRNRTSSNVGNEHLDSQSVQRKRRKFKLDPTLVHFDSLFGIDNWPRYLIFKTQTEMSAAKPEKLTFGQISIKRNDFQTLKSQRMAC